MKIEYVREDEKNPALLIGELVILKFKKLAM